jgi:hypothetical protein
MDGTGSTIHHGFQFVNIKVEELKGKVDKSDSARRKR